MAWLSAIACLVLLGVILFVSFALKRQATPSSPPPPRLTETLNKIPLDPTVARLLQSLEQETLTAPASDVAWGNLGLALLAHDLRKEARPYLRQAMAKAPHAPRWPYHLSQTYLGQDDARALQWLEYCLNLETSAPHKTATRLLLASLLLENGQSTDAEIILGQILDEAPDHPQANLLQARVALAQGKWEESSNYLTACFNHPATARQAHVLQGRLWLLQGNAQMAASMHTRAQTLAHDQSWVHPYDQELSQYLLGRQHLIETVPKLLAQNRLEDARRLTDHLLDDYPELPEGWLYAGRLAYLQNDWPQAERSLEQHLSLKPESVDGLLQMAQLRLAQSRAQDCRELLRRALQIKPDSHLAHYQLGEVQWRLGETNKALASWKQAANCDPAFMEAYLRRAQIQYATGHADEAYATLSKALQVDPYDLRVQQMMEQLAEAR